MPIELRTFFCRAFPAKNSSCPDRKFGLSTFMELSRPFSSTAPSGRVVEIQRKILVRGQGVSSEDSAGKKSAWEPPPNSCPSPSSPSSNVRFSWSRALGRTTRRVRDSAPPIKIKAYYKQTTGGAARAHGPGRVKTCGLSPIYNNIVIIGHREIVSPQVESQKHILVAPRSCAQPPCYLQEDPVELDSSPTL